MNFYDLVHRACRKNRKAHEAPRSTAWAAAECGISLSYLYCLINGERVARRHKVALIAKGLSLPPYVVQRALDRSREEAEVVT